MLKKCIKCGEDKLLSEFRRDSSHRDGRRSDCKICSRKYNQALYTTLYGEKARTRNRQRHIDTIAKINEYKKCELYA